MKKILMTNGRSATKRFSISGELFLFLYKSAPVLKQNSLKKVIFLEHCSFLGNIRIPKALGVYMLKDSASRVKEPYSRTMKF